MSSIAREPQRRLRGARLDARRGLGSRALTAPTRNRSDIDGRVPARGARRRDISMRAVAMMDMAPVCADLQPPYRTSGREVLERPGVAEDAESRPVVAGQPMRLSLHRCETERLQRQRQRGAAPRPSGLFSSVSDPPCASAICRHSTRPMPEPPGLVVKNGTNRFDVFDRPGPSSSTQMSMP